ncbi:STN domain-containing protein [Pedobacter sp. ASV28]|uniref:STN domain-containing protein n=1 Tax=Pedobacter sp. ASV28 TaxID=2795123 RepID=UPI0018EC33FA|nr:STN domain-containing protein [Pedobacter sp. ASV28]
MKVTLLILIAFLQVNTHELNKKMTFRKKGAELIQIIKEIKKQTGYSVAWNEKEVNVERKINVNFKNANIKTVLDEISKKLNISYISYKHTFVLVKATSPVPLQKIK